MIIDLMGEVCKRLAQRRGHTVNYVFGDSSYMREYLLRMGKFRGKEPVKYPLIGLYSPFNEYRDSNEYDCKADVNLIIAVNTLDSYTNNERLEISFKKILRPLYEGFIEELKSQKRFDFGYGPVKHVYSENYSFGRRGAVDVDGESLNDKIDAIEIKNLELTIKKENCNAIRH